MSEKAEMNEENLEVEMNEETQETMRKAILVHKGLPESLKGVDGVEREIWIWLSHDFGTSAIFYFFREANDPTLWVVGVDLYGYGLERVRGQEVIKEALVRFKMPTMDQLAGKAMYNSVALYQESDNDIYEKSIEARSMCGFQVLVSEMVAAELLERLKANAPGENTCDRYEEILDLENDSDEKQDEDGADAEDEVTEREDGEQYEEAVEFRGLEDLRKACAKRKFGDAKYGIEYNCSLTMAEDETWELELSVLDYDAAHGNGQLVMESILEECGLPGMRKLSKMANCDKTMPTYGEWYDSWLNAMISFSDPDERNDAERETCFFTAMFGKEKFPELLEEMQAKIPEGEIAYMYNK